MKRYFKFNYLYRDASNYKRWGSIVFIHSGNQSIAKIDEQLRDAFDQEVLFIAHQISIPELFLYAEGSLNEDDHCYHEYDSIEEISIADISAGQKTIKNFLEKVLSASQVGWNIFNPVDTLKIIKERHKRL